MEADDLGTYVVKYRGAGQGLATLVAEVVSGQLARAVGLPFGGVMSQVVLPQAFRASVPPLASVQIALL